MIFRITGWLLKALPILLLIIAFISIRINNRNFDIARVKSALGIIKKRWVTLAIITLIYFVLLSLNNYLYLAANPSLTVKYNYSEASKGQNPNETRFNPSEIISDEILSKVISQGQYNVSVSSLSKTLKLRSEFDNQELNLEEPEKSFLATEYDVVYTPTFATFFINGKEMMNLIADTYYQSFIEKYTENDEILDISFDDMEDIDYCDMQDYLNQKMTILIQYIDDYGTENSNFHMENGETFWGLSSRMCTYRDVEIQKLDSYIRENGLSKNRNTFKTVKQYENKLIKRDYDYEMANYRVNIEAVEKYNPIMARIVLVPSQNADLEYYMATTRIGPDDFSTSAMDSLNKAKEYQESIRTNDYFISAVSSSTAGTKEYQTADTMLEDIKAQIVQFSEECRDTCNVYISTKRKGYLQTVVSNSDVISGAKAAIPYAGAFLLGLIMLVIAAYISQIDSLRGEDR